METVRLDRRDRRERTNLIRGGDSPQIEIGVADVVG